MMLQKLLLILDIIGLDPADCTDALSIPINDFEDAIIAVCARTISADCIVVCDERFINAGTEVKVITPTQLVEKLS